MDSFNKIEADVLKDIKACEDLVDVHKNAEEELNRLLKSMDTRAFNETKEVINTMIPNMSKATAEDIQKCNYGFTLEQAEEIARKINLG